MQIMRKLSTVASWYCELRDREAATRLHESRKPNDTVGMVL